MAPTTAPGVTMGVIPAAAPVSPWMNSAQAAAYLGRGRRFVLGEVKAGRLRAATVGGRREVLTRRDWLDAWVEQQARPVLVGRRIG